MLDNYQAWIDGHTGFVMILGLIYVVGFVVDLLDSYVRRDFARWRKYYPINFFFCTLLIAVFWFIFLLCRLYRKMG